ncbi:MAG: hypothetical protein H6608_00060 [Flavobacteriales bacterium]|nr:hypothetical protein [Flavobacteriales bacterium]
MNKSQRILLMAVICISSATNLSAQHFGNQFFLRNMMTPFEWQTDVSFGAISWNNSPGKYYLLRNHISLEHSMVTLVTTGKLSALPQSAPTNIQLQQPWGYRRQRIQIGYRMQTAGLQEAVVRYQPKFKKNPKWGTMNLMVTGGYRNWKNTHQLDPVNTWSDHYQDAQGTLDFSIDGRKQKFYVNAYLLTGMGRSYNRFIQGGIYPENTDDNLLSGNRIQYERYLSPNVTWTTSLHLNHFSNTSIHEPPIYRRYELRHLQESLSSGIRVNRKKMSLTTSLMAQANQDQERSSTGFELDQQRSYAGLYQEWIRYFKTENNNRFLTIQFEHSILYSTSSTLVRGWRYNPSLHLSYQRNPFTLTAGAALNEQDVYTNQLYRVVHNPMAGYRIPGVTTESYRSIWLHGSYQIHSHGSLKFQYNSMEISNRYIYGSPSDRMDLSNDQARLTYNFSKERLNGELAYTYTTNQNSQQLELIPENRITLALSPTRPYYSRYWSYVGNDFLITPSVNLGYQSGYDLPVLNGERIRTKESMYADAFVRFGLSRGYYYPNRCSLEVGVTNLFNQVPYDQGTDFSEQIAFRNIQGRRFQVGLRFGLGGND